MVINCFSFAPLQYISDKTADIIAKKKAQLLNTGGRLPPGLRRQYEIQLKHLEDRHTADVELMTSANSPQPLPLPERAYVGIYSSLGHPWSRGTVVSYNAMMYRYFYYHILAALCVF